MRLFLYVLVGGIAFQLFLPWWVSALVAFGLAFAILLAMALHAWLLRRRLRRKLAALQGEAAEEA